MKYCTNPPNFYLGPSTETRIAPCLNVLLPSLYFWKKREDNPPQGAPPSLPRDPLLQMETLRWDVVSLDGPGQTARRRKRVVPLWKVTWMPT